VFSPGEDGNSSRFLNVASGWRVCVAAGLVLCVLIAGCAGDAVREPASRPAPPREAKIHPRRGPRRSLPPPLLLASVVHGESPAAEAKGVKEEVKPTDVPSASPLPSPPVAPAASPSPAERDAARTEMLSGLAADAFDDGRLEEAARLFEQVIRIAPQRSPAYYRLALVLETLGRPDDAMAAYRGLRRNGAGVRWKRLAETRLAALAGDLAVSRMRQAHERVARGAFVDAMALLRTAYAPELSPGTEYLLRAMYYRALGREIGARVSSAMSRAPAFVLGLASVLASDDDGKEANGREFERRLQIALRGAGVEDIVTLRVTPSAAERLLGGGSAAAGEGPERAGVQMALVDCVLVADFGEQIHLALVDAARGRTLWWATYMAMGPVPADIDSEAWRLLTRRVPFEGDFRAESWGGMQKTAESPLELSYRAGESSYVTMLLVHEDGSGSVLVPSSSQQDSFVLAEETRSLLVEPPAAGTATGVVMLASHTPLPGDVTEQVFDAAEMLRLAESLLRELEGRGPGTWAAAYWTWRSPAAASASAAGSTRR